MSTARALDVLVVSLGSTQGLRAADGQLVDALRDAGAQAELVSCVAPREVRTFALTDLAWARAARRAAAGALARRSVAAVVYSSTTAALLWPRPGAIRFDAPAAANRPGRDGFWQRPLERRRLRAAPVLVPWSEAGLVEAGVGGADFSGASLTEAGGQRTIVLPVAVDPRRERGGDDDAQRDIAALAYVANPHKKGLDVMLAAWALARAPGEELLLAGAAVEVRADGVRMVGRLEADAYRTLLGRARVFVSAPRREDYGISQLEALADGCRLVTTAAPGPYVALGLARVLDSRLVVGDDQQSGQALAAALRTALDAPSDDYAERALQLLAPFRGEAVRRVVAEQLLPALLAASAGGATASAAATPAARS